MLIDLCPYVTHQKRNPRGISRLGRRLLERGSRLRRRVPLPAPLEGLLDDIRFGYNLVGFGAVLGNGAEGAAVIQNQLIGLLGLVALAAGTAVEAGLAAKEISRRWLRWLRWLSTKFHRTSEPP